MGVRGLSSFIHGNGNLLKNHQLKDSLVVVDGFNFLFLLGDQVESSYGGEYKELEVTIIKIINFLRKCNIEPLLLFDGSEDPSNIKLRTAMDRFKQKISMGLSGPYRKSPLPLLATINFFQVLKKLKVKLVTCNFEADEDIVAVANHFHCPVVSNDSDFFISDIEGGYIPLNSINFYPCEGAIQDDHPFWFLNCKIYHVENLTDIFPNVNKECLPLFSAMMGNDYIHIKEFDSFYDQIRYPKNKSKSLKVTLRHQKLVGLLSWFSNQSIEEALEQVLKYLQKERRTELRDLINNIISRYQPKQNFLLLSCLEGKKLVNETLYDQRMVSLMGNHLPSWLLDRFQRCEIHSCVLSLLCVRRMFLQPQVDYISAPSCHQLSTSLRLFMYSIVLSIEGEDLIIQEYDRRGHRVNVTDVNVKISSRENGLPKLSELEDLSSSDKKHLLVNILEADKFKFENFPEKLHFPLAVLCYFYKRIKSALGANAFRSILVSFVFFEIVRPNRKPCYQNLYPENESEESCPLKYLSGPLLEQNVSKTMEILKKFLKKPDHTNVKNFRPDVINQFSQFQSCWYFAWILNQLFELPFLPISLYFFKGTFLYNLCNKLENTADPDLCISEYFGKGTNMHKLFTSVVTSFKTAAPEVVLVPNEVAKKKKIGKNKSGKSKLKLSEVSKSRNIFDMLSE